MKLAGIIDNFDSLKETDEGLTQFNLAKHYIIDKLEENKLIHDFIFFASLILKNRIKLEKNPKESDLRKRSISLFDKISEADVVNHPLKLNLAFIIFVIDVLKGDFKNSKIDLLERIVEVNANHFVPSNNPIVLFFHFLRSIYSLDEIVEILKNNVFKGKFWNKSLLSKKTAFLWASPIFWNCFGCERQFKSLYESSCL